MFLAQNIVYIVPGHCDEVIERFTLRQGIETIDGFIKMYVTKVEGLDSEHDRINVFTFWKDELAFNTWLKSDVFKQAHKNVRTKNDDIKSIIIGNKVVKHQVGVEFIK